MPGTVFTMKRVKKYFQTIQNILPIVRQITSVITWRTSLVPMESEFTLKADEQQITVF